MAGQSTENFLPLTEYSSKYKVSISTLRRRIKAKDIQFRFDQGKYMIFDSESPQRPSQEIANLPRPSPKSFEKKEARNEEKWVEKTRTSSSSSMASDEFLANMGGHSSLTQNFGASTSSSVLKNDEPILTAANRLLTELKKAYTQILQEKEEQVLHLKEEVSDLKTLVRVLESENERLKRF
jgi:hypothetical protein